MRAEPVPAAGFVLLCTYSEIDTIDSAFFRWITSRNAPKFVLIASVSLEAAIGIEPMNKGFAVLAKVFAQVQPCLLVSIFISVFDISSLHVIG
jgi:hypothetical protein